MNGEGKNPHGEKAEDTAFGSHRAAREPFGAVQGCIRQVSFEDEAAVRHRVKECLAEIKTRVPSHNQPEIPGTPQGKREKQPDGHDPRCSLPAFTGIPQMDSPKRARKHNRCRPEADAPRERVLRISSKREFFKQAHKHKEDSPQYSPTNQLFAMQRK